MPRKYTNEFKRDALKYLEEHPDMDKKVAASYLNVPYDTLYGWWKHYQREKRGVTKENLNTPMTEEEKEIMRLRRELRDTRDALDILKKLSASWENNRYNIY